MTIDLGGLLTQLMGANSPATNPQDQFHQLSRNAPADLLSQGLSAMFRSDQTPAFSQMTGQLFDQANPDQRAGMLNQLLASVGPGLLGALTSSGNGGGGLAAIIGQLTQGGQPRLTAEQAGALSADQASLIASHAEQHSPGIVEQMSSFYAEHPGLVKTLGGAALSIALARMAESHRA